MRENDVSKFFITLENIPDKSRVLREIVYIITCDKIESIMLSRLSFFCVVFLELIIVTYLAHKIIFQQKVLGESISINPIPRNSIIFSNLENSSGDRQGERILKYFYEPVPNSVETFLPEWLPTNYKYTATINADSLNERFDYPIEKDPNVFRILTIGDSYTFGWVVNTEENYPERLEDLLNNDISCANVKKFEVINLGVGGYDIQYSLERLKKRGIKYKPDLVLWLLKNDDFSQLREVEETIARQEYNRMMVDATTSANLDELSYLHGRGFYSLVLKARDQLKNQLSQQDKILYQMKALQGINSYYQGKLVFIAFSPKRKLENEYMSELESMSKTQKDIYFYDKLDSSYDRFSKDPHPTSKGYAQIAGHIFNYLMQSHLLPCNY